MLDLHEVRMVSAAIFGQEGDDDNLRSEEGEDYIEGYAGNDVISSDGFGSDDIWAGSRSDKLTLKGDNDGVERVLIDDTMSISIFNITNGKNGGKN